MASAKDEESHLDTEDLSFDPREVDRRYESYPNFTDWAEATVDQKRWDRYLERLERRGEISEELLGKAVEVVKRAAAIDTGAIEGLYDTDRGFTFTVATEAATWQAVLGDRDEKTRQLIDAQLGAYDFVLDFATGAREVRQAWIRTLHEQVCANQDTYTVYTEQGKQERQLSKGEYKSFPNHVRTSEGKVHAYAPVEATPEEMHRLCNELQSEEFKEAHPVLQASYAHYGLVAIHPFADGNGRVARALASVFTYRAANIPLLILADQREEYFAALRKADNKDYQPFVDFSLERCLDAIQLVDESLRTAEAPDPASELKNLDELYLTRGGYTQGEVDEAAQQFLQLVNNRLRSRGGEYQEKSDNAAVNVKTRSSNHSPDDPNYRAVSQKPNQQIDIHLSSSPPAKAAVHRRYYLEVPTDAGEEDDLRLVEQNSEDTITARIEEVIPEPSGALDMRITMSAERILGEMVREVRAQTKKRF